MEHLRSINTSLERTRALYQDVFTQEQKRLEGALWLEKRTSLHVLGQELKPASRVLDLGCAAGVYALPLARSGHSVLAVDLVDHHIQSLKEQLEPGMALEAQVLDAQSAVDMQADASFDAVLCLGPMYHLVTEQERVQLLEGCLRVVKPGGKVFLSFINNDWVIATMTLDNGEDTSYITMGDYDKASFRCKDFPFVFHTLSQAQAEIERVGLQISRRINSDGLNELFRCQFAAFSPQEKDAWFAYHLNLCEQPHHLGACNHWLFVCERTSI